MSGTRSTRRSTRLRDHDTGGSTDSRRSIEEVAPTPEPVAKRQKVPGQVDWQGMVSEETLVQLARHPLDVVNLIETRFDDLSAVRSTWEYQYAIAWINNVSESFVTGQIYPGGKAMWKVVEFDEVLFMKDLMTVRDQNVEYSEMHLAAESGDEQDMNMYDLVRLSLLRQLGNNKSIELEQWNELVNEFLGEREDLATLQFGNTPFFKVEVLDQFRIFYEMIKQIEAKNMVFKNFLLNNMELFEFIKVDYESLTDNSTDATAVFLTTPYSVVERVEYAQDQEKRLTIPLKLQNCTVKYEDEDGQTELVHIDYSNEIDSYINNFQVKYNVLCYNFDTFLKSFQAFKDRLKRKEKVKGVVEGFENTLEWMVLSKIDSAKRLIQREKKKSMKELLVRRKRSSRLIKKEEQVKQDDIENELEDKYDEREAFLKKRNRALARVVKRCKENLWNQLWLKYDQDVKNEKLKHKGEAFSLIDGVTPEDPLSAVDKFILPNGINFNARVIPTNVITSDSDDQAALRLEELPANLCLNAEDIKKGIELGVMSEAIDPDNNDDWLFQCSCMSSSDEVKAEGVEAPVKPVESKPVTIHNSDGEEVNHAKYQKLDILDRPIVCCDQCHKWQHWQCQDNYLVELLSYAAVHSKKDLDNMKFLTQRDFATVQYDSNPIYQSSTRRTSRRQHQEEEQEIKHSNSLRPTDRRTVFGESAVFVCRMCLGRYETEQRGTFQHELGLLRLKQKKNHDERERRKERKLLEKKQAQMQTQMQTNIPPQMQAQVHMQTNIPPQMQVNPQTPNPWAITQTMGNPPSVAPPVISQTMGNLPSIAPPVITQSTGQVPQAGSPVTTQTMNQSPPSSSSSPSTTNPPNPL